MYRRVLLGIFLLVGVLALPASASAATAQTQIFTVTADVSGLSGVCPALMVSGGSNPAAAAMGVVNDSSGIFDFYAAPSGPFPNQWTGEFLFEGAHSSAELVFTATARCVGPQSIYFSGGVWSGTMYDEATNRTYDITGAGRGNSITITSGTTGFVVTFTGTARLTTSQPKMITTTVHR